LLLKGINVYGDFDDIPCGQIAFKHMQS
jgi:hypothetical protein